MLRILARLGVAFAALLSLSACVVLESTYDISADLPQQYPVESGIYEKVRDPNLQNTSQPEDKEARLTTITRTHEGYLIGSAKEALPTRFFKLAGMPADHYVMQVLKVEDGKGPFYHYFHVSLTTSRFVVYIADDKTEGGKKQVLPPDLKALLKDEDTGLYILKNPAKQTLFFLQEVIRRKLKFKPMDVYNRVTS